MENLNYKTLNFSLFNEANSDKTVANEYKKAQNICSNIAQKQISLRDSLELYFLSGKKDTFQDIIVIKNFVT